MTAMLSGIYRLTTGHTGSVRTLSWTALLPMHILKKLEILADAAKYDASCASSGTSKRDSRGGTGIGSTEGSGICHSYAPDGRCISLLKIKHFKFEPRGKRRLHKKPADAEIDACHPWLERELTLVKPALVVALGGTAARALLGRATGVEANRGRLAEVPGGPAMMITVHPSYLLRVPQEEHQREYERFVADLSRMLPYLCQGSSAAKG